MFGQPEVVVFRDRLVPGSFVVVHGIVLSDREEEKCLA